MLYLTERDNERLIQYAAKVLDIVARRWYMTPREILSSERGWFLRRARAREDVIRIMRGTVRVRPYMRSRPSPLIIRPSGVSNKAAKGYQQLPLKNIGKLMGRSFKVMVDLTRRMQERNNHGTITLTSYRRFIYNREKRGVGTKA